MNKKFRDIIRIKWDDVDEQELQEFFNEIKKRKSKWKK